jgi:hypothetical protein
MSMPEINIGEAASAGLRMMARQPLAVLCWGLLMALYVGLLFLMFGTGIAAAISSLVATGGGEPAPAQILALIGACFGFFFFLVVGGQLLALVFRAAAIRAELEPEASAFAYMRFGGQEMWMLGTSLVFWLVLLAANILMSIPLGILTFATAAGSIATAAHGGGAAMGGMLAATSGIRFLGQLAITGVSIWLWLRLCLGVVMTFKEQQFRLFESWSATRGHVWRMFLTMLIVGLIEFAIGLVMFIIAAVTAGVTITGIAQDPQAFFSQPPTVWLGAMTPLLVVALIWIVVATSVSNALAWGAVARMWRQLHPDSDVAKAFV